MSDTRAVQEIRSGDWVKVLLSYDDGRYIEMQARKNRCTKSQVVKVLLRAAIEANKHHPPPL